jgi:hypothetical protein
MWALRVGLLLGIFAMSASAAQPLRIAIVPSRSVTAERSIVAARNADPFFVVLSNTSAVQLGTWEVSNSWGYGTLSFELTTSDGTRRILTKRPEAFTRNGPSVFIVLPGEQRVLVVRLDSSWNGLPNFFAPGEQDVRLRAVYDVPASPEAAKLHVWVGRIASPEYAIRLRHW